MLLPSDVARLVLGYLQQEGLSATSRAFILESSNLREYAEHSSEDGVIPACVSMQNSPAVQQIQRLRTLNSIQNRRQRVLSLSQTPATGCLSVSSPGNCVPRAIPNPQGILGHSTPVCYTSQLTRSSTISLPQSEEATLQIIVPDHRFTPGPLSPARRKCDSPRRRGGQIGVNRGVTVSSVPMVESQSQEAVTENLSQMVIENAREKILNDRSLQEKLAENINKILASDNSPQTSRSACNTVEQEQSIDEILGLQGEIHMTDDAIQDILEQTESDPAFQALFDLFDYGKNKMSESSENADKSNSTQESDEPAHMDIVTDTGTGQDDLTSEGETTTRVLRSRNAKEAKSKRKPNTSGVSKQTANPKETQNKKGSSKSRGSASKKQTRGISSTIKEQLTNKATTKSSSDTSLSSSCLSDQGASMDVDDPRSDMSQEFSSQEASKQVLQELPQILTSSKNAPVFTKQTETTLEAGADLSESRCEAETASVSASGQGVSEQPATIKDSLHDTVTQELSANITKSSSPVSISFEPSAVSVSTVHSSASSASTMLSPSQSQPPESDPNKIVALKIIISDEQEQQASDSALNQAVSSISSELIPTIFLSSPAKSLTKVLPSTPGSSITPEETAQAVSSLQGAESTSDPVVGLQNNLQPAQARPLAPETGFIQLLPANPTFGGTSSYFVVTDPSSGVDQHSGMMMLSSGEGEKAICSTPHVVATPPRSRAVVSITPNVAQSFSPAKTGTSVAGPNQVSNCSQSLDQGNNTTGASPSHRRILCFDENTSQTSTNAAAAFTRTEQTRPCISGHTNAKKRIETIRLSDPSQSIGTKPSEKFTTPQQQKKAAESTQAETGTDQIVNSRPSPNKSVQQQTSGILESKNPEHSLNPSTQNQDSTNKGKDASQEEKHEQRALKTHEGPSKSNVTQNSSNIAANKENEVEASQQEVCQAATPISSTVRPATQDGIVKSTCKTSPLTKQAVEMLQDIQSQSPISTPPRRKGTTDLPLPKTPVPGRLQEDLVDGLRTPLRQRHGREGEATPKKLAPPATPELPTCSPASEAGSENSINMAAHTLMILSRAARTGGPLKDSLRQEEAGAAKSSASKGKKRKHAEPSPTAKKELQLTGSSSSKKKAKKQKKLLDSFPHDLDVDKFLSSLHYDE
ncbi:Protein NPAT [Bagarius yarrelli]|uniref:Protein NPAT n=1 Tax=Bagarius yarrelli TaxID=175774 RepID=A0A556U6W2_BAGYA|nr:Protein NPAT [Bagarius yarrelli]